MKFRISIFKIDFQIQKFKILDLAEFLIFDFAFSNLKKEKPDSISEPGFGDSIFELELDAIATRDPFRLVRLPPIC
jgi:hypothetical protein